MGRLEARHWVTLGTFLTALAGMLGGYDGWHDLTKMSVWMGILGLIGSHLVAIYSGAPQDPDLNVIQNPHRREVDNPPVKP